MIDHFYRKLRNTILTGFFVLLPILITIASIVFIFNLFEKMLARPVSAILKLIGLPTLINYHIPGILGLGLLIIFSLLLGLIVKNVVGRKTIIMGEKILSKVPLVWNIYYASKQIMESFSIGSKYLQKVVLIEYPRKGLYTIGFITSEAKNEIQDVTKEDVINVFVPTTPNPTSGLLVMVPREDIIYLSMSIEDGIKLVVSGGMVVPNNGRSNLNSGSSLNG